MMRVSVYVQPGAKKTEIQSMHDGRPKIRICAPPVDGAANEELIRFVSKLLKIPKSSVELTAGHASRLKTLQIEADDEKIRSAFGIEE